MERRREPRFQVRSPLRVSVLRDPDRELECVLTDISGAGMRFVATEGLLEGDIVVAETGEHLILAEVRNSQPRGDKHVIGILRLHAVLKDNLPQGSGRIEQIETLMKDLGSRVQTGLADASGSPHEPLQGDVREQLSIAAAEKILATWESFKPGSDRQPGSTRALGSLDVTLETSADGNTNPVFIVRHSSTSDGQGNIAAGVQFWLSLRGTDPLQDLIVRLVRITACDPKTGAVGPVIFHQRFETFSGRGEDWRTLSGPHDLKGDRTVFQATFAARNGDWNQVIKMRRVSSVWESRSVVFRNLGASRPIQKISEEVSQNFPAEQLRIPIVPVTAEDLEA
jgi:hypothetical protein